MRGCLFTLLLGGVVVGFIVVVGLPAVAAGILTAAVAGAGLAAGDTTVTVNSDPPTDLLGLRADTVHITATDADFRGMRIGSLDIVLGDVAVLERTAGAVDGELRHVTVRAADGKRVSIDRITIGGTPGRLTTTTLIPGTEAEGLIADAIEAQTGARPSGVAITAPDRLSLSAGGLAMKGTLAVNGTGDLVVRATAGPIGDAEVVLLRGGEDLPIELTSVRVTPSGALRLVGELRVGILG